MSQRNQGIISGIEGTVTIHSDVDATTSAVLQNNWTATIAPAITDDSGAGYAVGSEWIDVTADKSYKLVDASVGAAVWIETTGGGGAFLPLAGGTMDSAADIKLNSNPDGLTVAGKLMFGDNSYITSDEDENGWIDLVTDDRARIVQKDGFGEMHITTSSFNAHVGGLGSTTGQLLLLANITSTSRIWEMPDASGTVALTSDIINPSLINTAVTTTFVNPNETINCTSGTFAVNLPSANPIQGTTFTLVNTGTGVITLTPAAGDFINGASGVTLTQYVSRTVQSDGNNWIII